MRKIVLIVLMALLYTPVFSDITYEINTKYGKEQVVIPDGYTEKDVLLKLAEAYYEQDHDIKELEEEITNLIKASEDYISENKSLRLKYEDLIKDYDVLVNRLNLRNNLNWFKGYIGVQYSPYKGQPGLGATIGSLLFNKVFISATANYYVADSTLGFSIGAGILL